ncbi:MAG TPA: hypothetical protein VGI17_03635 [Solirubrobacterales bacterium]
MQDESEEQPIDHRSPITKGAIAEEGLHDDKGILMAGTIVASQAEKRQASGNGRNERLADKGSPPDRMTIITTLPRMAGLDDTDAFFELIVAEIAPRLGADPPASLSHWMIIHDATA